MEEPTSRSFEVHRLGTDNVPPGPSSEVITLLQMMLEMMKTMQLMYARFRSQPPLCLGCKRWGHMEANCWFRVVCQQCHTRGHDDPFCSRSPKPICEHCGNPGHRVDDCWRKFPHLRPGQPRSLAPGPLSDHLASYLEFDPMVSAASTTVRSDVRMKRLHNVTRDPPPGFARQFQKFDLREPGTDSGGARSMPETLPVAPESSYDVLQDLLRKKVDITLEQLLSVAPGLRSEVQQLASASVAVDETLQAVQFYDQFSTKAVVTHQSRAVDDVLVPIVFNQGNQVSSRLATPTLQAVGGGLSALKQDELLKNKWLRSNTSSQLVKTEMNKRELVAEKVKLEELVCVREKQIEGLKEKLEVVQEIFQECAKEATKLKKRVHELEGQLEFFKANTTVNSSSESLKHEESLQDEEKQDEDLEHELNKTNKLEDQSSDGEKVDDGKRDRSFRYRLASADWEVVQ